MQKHCQLSFSVLVECFIWYIYNMNKSTFWTLAPNRVASGSKCHSKCTQQQNIYCWNLLAVGLSHLCFFFFFFFAYTPILLGKEWYIYAHHGFVDFKTSFLYRWRLSKLLGFRLLVGASIRPLCSSLQSLCSRPYNCLSHRAQAQPYGCIGGFSATFVFLKLGEVTEVKAC